MKDRVEFYLTLLAASISCAALADHFSKGTFWLVMGAVYTSVAAYEKMTYEQR